MDCRAQVSFEYLILATFAIVLAIAAALLLDSLRTVSLSTKADILNYRNKTISSIMG
ncbi:MAG: hypothetical protein PHH08_02245 [Candidatus ainarchaeum sp.]|nr:hypothetical protein [Candidatus ainarchaeum sp.]